MKRPYGRRLHLLLKPCIRRGWHLSPPRGFPCFAGKFCLLQLVGSLARSVLTLTLTLTTGAEAAARLVLG